MNFFFFLSLVYVERGYKSNRLIFTEREAVAGQSDFFCNKGGLYSEISRTRFVTSSNKYLLTSSTKHTLYKLDHHSALVFIRPLLFSLANVSLSLRCIYMGSDIVCVHM